MIFQNEKTPFQAIKKRSLESQKIDIFPKGFIHGFRPKMASCQMFFFQATQARKMSFMIFQNEKTPFIAIKTRSSKTRKIDIFPKRLTHAFAPNMAIFPSFLFRQYRPAKCLYDILEQKTPFQATKNGSKIVEKLTFFQRVKQWFWSKNGHFFNFFFRQYRSGECLLWYSRTKKRFCRL